MPIAFAVFAHASNARSRSRTRNRGAWSMGTLRAVVERSMLRLDVQSRPRVRRDGVCGPGSPGQTRGGRSLWGPRRNPRRRSVPCDSPGTCATSVTAAADGGPCISRLWPDTRQSRVQQFAVDSWGAPERICCGHRANQSTDVRPDGRSIHATTALPRPEAAEALTVPCDDRLRLDDDERGSPVVPHPREPYPEEAVGLRKSQSTTARPLKYLELVTQREHLELKCGTRSHATAEGQEEREEN